MRSRFALPAVVFAAGLATATGAEAQTNYASLTSAVDWSTAITALMAVGALLVGVLVVKKGIRFVLSILR